MPSFGCNAPCTSVHIPCAEYNLQVSMTGPIASSIYVNFPYEKGAIHWIEKMKHHGRCFLWLY